MPRLAITLLALWIGLVAPAFAVREHGLVRHHRHERPVVVDLPVSFAVRNLNRSRVVCPTDGRPYTVRGHLVAPRSVLTARQPTVTLYLHGGVFGEATWRFHEVPGYDYGYALAKAGHASIAIDQLGYGHSSIPNGQVICLGGQADVAHQIVGQLRTAGYSLAGAPAVRFAHVALAANSAGGLPVGIEAYSFRDVDALLIVDSAFDQGPSAPTDAPLTSNYGFTCAHGGDPKRPGGPGGYSWAFGRHLSELGVTQSAPAVVAAALRTAERDPCGFIPGYAPPRSPTAST